MRKTFRVTMTENEPKSKRRLQIEDGLKQVYDTYSNTDVPDRFSALLDQLKNEESGAAPKQDAEVDETS